MTTTTENPAESTCSEARLLANRTNAQNSSGPKTEEGKKRSSLNATRHGLLAQTLHLPEEEMDAYREFTAAYDDVTNGCNGCHKELGYDFNVIVRPTTPPFSDQEYAPAKPG